MGGGSFSQNMDSRAAAAASALLVALGAMLVLRVIRRERKVAKEPEAAEFKTTTPSKELFLAGYDLVVDVRGEEERRTMFGWIPTSVCVPLNEIEAGAVPPVVGKEASILMVCRSGRRSEKALLTLKKKGYSNLTNLVGGTQKWVEDGLPTADPLKKAVYVEAFVKSLPDGVVTPKAVRDEIVMIFATERAQFLGKESLAFGAAEEIMKMVFEEAKCSWNEPDKAGLERVVTQFTLKFRHGFDLSFFAETTAKMIAIVDKL